MGNVRDMKGILTDLDGTLLDVDMNYFLPRYLKEMTAFAVKTGLVPRENHLAPLILRGTDAMLENQDLSKTNEEVFADCFFQDPYFAERREQTLQFFDVFYQEVFPKLDVYCKTFPFAQRLTETMFETGLPVVLATSPVFPLSAVEARLRWAGIADYPFQLKTSYEIMHTCKPHRSYFQEVAQMVGLEPKDCLMIGNDKQDDLPAARAGMQTYLLEEAVLDNGEGALEPSYHGKAEDLIAFLQNLTEK